MEPVLFTLHAWQAILLCLLFATIYVGSLYAWINNTNRTRDHPEIIKRRFVSVGIVALIVPPLLWCYSKYQTSSTPDGHTLFEWLGLRFWGFLPAFILPLLLTMVLFAGPLYLHYIDGVFSLYLEPKYWSNSFKSLIWLRNHLVAPFSEEFIFRACMLPVLVPSFGEWYAVFFCPLFFGVAHFHHMIETVIFGHQAVKDALKQSIFQLFYTTIFGAYSAFLFLRTGHLVAPVIAHAFCNHMGFPPFNEVMAHQQPGRSRIIFFFVAGLASWLLLLYPLTAPTFYSNEVYKL
ncbi:CAAX prenyl protease 2-like [Argonauta hians]